MKKTVLSRVATIALAVLPLTLLATNSSASTPPTVNVVGYSIVADAYSALETAFQHTLAGEGVTFTNSFGASTTQAEDVVAGQPADVVNFSLQPDLQLLVNAHLVSKKWASYPGVKSQKGMVTDSTVAIVVRPGDPLAINGWRDLLRSGVTIVTPDPISSGSARWNLLAAYESQIAQGLKPAAAATFLNSLIGNVIAEPSSGSKALSTFLAGTGNVLLAYEADALAAYASGQKIQIVQPPQNFLIENPAALTTTGTRNPGAKAFYGFIFSKAGQLIWLHYFFRPTLPSLTPLLKTTLYSPRVMTKVSSLGGWTQVNNKFFSPHGIITKAEAAHGYTS
jgi:ABC-type sulfate transport system substrate-binding protein